MVVSFNAFQQSSSLLPPLRTLRDFGSCSTLATVDGISMFEMVLAVAVVADSLVLVIVVNSKDR
jgi:hypothetical protein